MPYAGSKAKWGTFVRCSGLFLDWLPVRPYTLPMFGQFRRFVLFALLLLVPLQGLAAMAHALSCAQHDGHAAAVSGDSHSGHDHGTPHQHSDESAGGSANDHSSHHCCHHFSAAPVSTVIPPPIDLSAFHSSVALFNLSAVLEQPQRPPRT
jgi:hypothetical protein